MRDNSVLIICLLIIGCIVLFGGQLGLAYSGGNVSKPVVSQEEPGVLSVFHTIWSGILFLFEMYSFTAQGCPAWLDMMIIIITLIPLIIFLKFVRGDNT